MSLLTILAAATTGGVVTPPPPTDPRPATDDPILAALRPNGRSIGTITVGPTGDYATIGAGRDAALTLQAASLASEGRTVPTPNDRVDILVEPGIYDEVLWIPGGKWFAFYAADPTQTTRLEHHNAAGVSTGDLGTLATNGAIYWEGIDVSLEKVAGQESNWPKYPIHHVGDRTSIFAACTLNAYSASAVALTPIGMDGVNGGTTLLYDVALGTGATNMHGSLDNSAATAETMIYVNCTSPSTINFQGMVASDGDLWVVDCTAATISANNATLHVSGSTGTVTLAGSATQDTNAAWPVPTGGLSAADRAYYGMPS